MHGKGRVLALITMMRNHPLGGVALFMGITLLFHGLWRVGRPLFEEASWYLALADVTTQQAYLASAWIIERVLGDAVVRLDAICTFRMTADGLAEPVTRFLIIDHTCSGLKQFYQALVLFLLYPGPRKHKPWFIPGVIVAMHLTNILRIVILGITMLHAYQHWDFVHDWVVRPMFYVVLFGLWVLWEQRFSISPAEARRPR